MVIERSVGIIECDEELLETGGREESGGIMGLRVLS